jgi:hypothetical protein
LKQKFKVTSDSYLLQLHDSIKLTSKSFQPESEDSKYLLSLTRTPKSFILACNDTEFKPKSFKYEKSWLVLKSQDNQGYCLSEGDTIRLGKAKLRIKEIKGPHQPRSNKYIPFSKHIFQGGIGEGIESEEDPQIVQTFSSQDEGNQCRICLQEDNTRQNPLVKPCKCTGSMALIHIECLQKWFTSKLTVREFNNATSYCWKSLKCELCKFDYPDRIEVNDKKFDLMVMSKPTDHYITLESGVKLNDSKNINIIPIRDKKNIRLGRAHDSDIRLSDISVSRNHANVQITDSGLFLKDVSSKFGTLVRIKKQITLTVGFKFSIQCGRNLIKISVKKPFRLFGCFSKCSSKKKREEENSRSFRDATDESFSNQF